MSEVKLCECGCEKELSPTQKKFKHGHNRRGLVSNTKGEKWSHHYDCCQKCGTTDRKHNSQGMCNTCDRKILYQKKKNIGSGKWSKEYLKCVDCGRKDRPHHAHGRCGTCHVNYLNRQKGKPRRNFGAWSWYYVQCINCKTTEISHVANGLCARCYSAKKQKTNNDKICPACSVPVSKLFQHISMKAKTCTSHQKYLDEQGKVAMRLFHTSKTSQELSDGSIFGKRFILRTWHKHFSDEEITNRGERIRVSKISAEKHYLHGKPFPAIQRSIIEYHSPAGKIYKMKSSWEVKLAQLLDEKYIPYLYEPEGFAYLDPEGIERHYWPDFYLSDFDVYVEVKGFMDELSKWKIQRFQENYSDKVLIVVSSEEEINEEFLSGLGW